MSDLSNSQEEPITIKVYLITNSINDKKYVGLTTATLKQRLDRHGFPSMKSKNMPIVFAIQKYGKDKFNIVQIDVAYSVKEANEKEVYWGTLHNCLSPNGYNLKLGGRFCVKTSEETRRKMREAGLKREYSEEDRNRMRELAKQKIGIPLSDEEKVVLSRFWKGKKKPQHIRDRSSQENSVKFIVKNPNGKIVKSQSIKKFAHENKLSVEKFRQMLQGKILEVDGWTLVKRLGFQGKRDR